MNVLRKIILDSNVFQLKETYYKYISFCKNDNVYLKNGILNYELCRWEWDRYKFLADFPTILSGNTKLNYSLINNNQS